MSKDKKVINTKTSREIKKTISGGYTTGYWIDKRFIPLDKMNLFCEKIPNIECPF
ncbi:MAG: hypothetical protein R3321_11330 [Nitrososphaeraceae archaeon]|nr:hypothetical protein [Nitrososphaeraceae archaeon]